MEWDDRRRSSCPASPTPAAAGKVVAKLQAALRRTTPDRGPTEALDRILLEREAWRRRWDSDPRIEVLQTSPLTTWVRRPWSAGVGTGDAGWPSRIRTSVHGSKVRCPTARRRASGNRGRARAGMNGAEDGTRTRDPHLGKVMLYQLSHFRSMTASRVVVPRGRLELPTPRFSVACSTS
jgi:hypothetical protein